MQGSKFSAETKVAVVAYAADHTLRETAKKFGVAPATVMRWKANGSTLETSHQRYPKEIVMLARKVQRLSQVSLGSGEVDDLALYGLLLTREILK